MDTAAETDPEFDQDRARAAVDAALGVAAHRRAYTRDEVVGELNDVLTQLVHGRHVEPALDVVDRALGSIDGQAVVDQGRVVDMLLDLRLALEPVPTVV
jgi:hypothetical protein